MLKKENQENDCGVVKEDLVSVLVCLALYTNDTADRVNEKGTVFNAVRVMVFVAEKTEVCIAKIDDYLQIVLFGKVLGSEDKNEPKGS